MAEKEIPGHACTGDECWVCGEPAELRRLRWNMRKAMLNKNTEGLNLSQCSDLSRICIDSIRAELVSMMEKARECCLTCGTSLRECEKCGT